MAFRGYVIIFVFRRFAVNYATLKETDIADGPGVRVALYVSGCQLALEGHPCRGCHNFKAWSKDYGEPFTEETEQLIIKYLEPDYIDGFSLLGGEPLSDFNVDRETQLLKHIKEVYPNKDIWMWTGYRLDRWAQKHPDKLEILKYVDTVIDGPFIPELMDLNLQFCGSKNQRTLDMSTYREKLLSKL